MDARQVEEFAKDMAKPLVEGPPGRSSGLHVFVFLEEIAEETRDQWLGCVLGGAIGDALGAPVEFASLDSIRRQYGTDGITDYGPVGRWTDDTQMTPFTLEGLIRAHVRKRLLGQRNPLAEVQLAYQRWLHTQGIPWEQAAGQFLPAYPEPDGWLISQRELFQLRAPGNTCLGALRRFGAGHPPATFTNRINDSKGCGGVMRAAPAALWSQDPPQVFQLGAAIAALTHSHPSGYLSAGAFAVILWETLWTGKPFRGVYTALEELKKWEGHEETTRALQAALDLSKKAWDRGKAPTPEEIETLGGGWTGEEALAIAVCAVLGTPYDNFERTLRVAVNHSGDSDSTGAIAGNIAGASFGLSGIPAHWIERLERKDVLFRIAEDAYREFGPNPPTDPEWFQRYPIKMSEGQDSGPAQPDPSMLW
ncbi:ADP-ribosylglycohydrolase family protein [Carbonactinospora thermoautotrophica]|uniref:ADP-ribosylglycohydrolase family protein n=1 Tax=Carbonactinospora thermoautotrophica TaxID=1469144 RepID=UPI000A5EE8F1|nr:ADP-ribosylglycohydrolase family protein [Carbonactinospora thermoautotrophica]